MVMVTKGMSAQRIQAVEDFDARASLVDLLLLLQEVVTNPKAMLDLAKAKSDALALTKEEEKRRMDALELIGRTEELKASFKLLDEKQAKVEQQHKDGLKQIDSMKTEAKQSFDSRDRAIKELEEKTSKIKSTADNALKAAQDVQKRAEEDIRKREEALKERDDGLKNFERDLARRFDEISAREKALLGK